MPQVAEPPPHLVHAPFARQGCCSGAHAAQWGSGTAHADHMHVVMCLCGPERLSEWQRVRAARGAFDSIRGVVVSEAYAAHLRRSSYGCGCGASCSPQPCSWACQPLLQEGGQLSEMPAVDWLVRHSHPPSSMGEHHMQPFVRLRVDAFTRAARIRSTSRRPPQSKGSIERARTNVDTRRHPDAGCGRAAAARQRRVMKTRCREW